MSAPRAWILGACACSLLASCVAPLGSGAAARSLEPGMWVVARGVDTAPGEPVASKIEQLVRDESMNATKVEFSARARSRVESGVFEILGDEVEVRDRTVYEDESKRSVPRFDVEPGAWYKVKARVRDGGLVARTLRKSAVRERFKVEGELGGVDPATPALEVGSIRLRLAQDAKIHVLSGGEAGVDLQDPLALFFADERKGVPFTIQLAEGLRVGGEGFLEGSYDNEFDLDRRRDGDRSGVKVDGKLDVLWRVGDTGAFVLVEGKGGRKERFRKAGPRSTQGRESLSRGYVYLPLTSGLRLELGRQDFDEEREWLYDEILDGVKLRTGLGDLDIEAGIAAGREHLDEPNETRGTWTWVGLARYNLTRRHHVSAYAIQRKDWTQTNFEPLVYGLRSFSKPWTGLGHWVEVARAGGYIGAKRVDGDALDFGLMWRFGTALRPTITIGWAKGSGRVSSAARVGFRQTGLQDNNMKIGGVTGFRYYGEVLEPELANLEIATVGFGIRPAKSFSIDLAWHAYTQDVADMSIVRTKLRTRPNGRSRDIGRGFDVILGQRVADRMSFELVWGRFEPGDGFDEKDSAHKFQVQTRVKF